jgi:hypothetical protein
VSEQEAEEKLRLLRLEVARRENCVMSDFIIYIPGKILLRGPNEG